MLTVVWHYRLHWQLETHKKVEQKGSRYWKNDKKRIILVDEISPDTCRLWDIKNEKKLDKDRFRKDLGGLIEAYQEVAKRLGIMPEGTNIKEIKTGISKTIKLKKS